MSKDRPSDFKVKSWFKTTIYIKMLDGSVIVDYVDIVEVREAISMVASKHNLDVNEIEGIWFEMTRVKPIKIYSEEPDFVKEYKKRVGESNGKC